MFGRPPTVSAANKSTSRGIPTISNQKSRLIPPRTGVSRATTGLAVRF